MAAIRSGHRGATAIRCAPDPGATIPQTAAFDLLFPRVMPKDCGHNPFYFLRARQERRDLDALEKRSARL
ncbi:hypothetical protein [Paenibacillus sp. MER 99-2]|uniref:hypothetical protein n=1 Tax=Paenibacillus sp. MER 99-2 TaxID=2939572 RepID=UPI002042126C|nr:hypothetical protein [Paenibacillus sp. MER 99-2]MCM3174640.1 hypothetical protein [Paenibacillus sp. MER 99-2]